MSLKNFLQSSGSKDKEIIEMEILGELDNETRPDDLSLATGTRSEFDAYNQLHDIIEEFVTEQIPILRVNPCLDRDHFNVEERYALTQRDFRTRVFFSELSIKGVNAWIRTHHTDVGQRPHIDYVREYFAASSSKNHIAAKAALTGILDSIFSMDQREYYNFATIMASCLSKEARHTSFQITDSLMKSYKSMPVARTMSRRRLTLLMNIVFGKISAHRFLQSNSNIFRLVYCQTKGSRHKFPLIYVAFSFGLQSCLGLFVIAQVLTTSRPQTDPNLAIGLLILASLGSLFGFFSTLPDIANYKTIFGVYGSKIGVIYLIDLFVNVFIPLFLVVSGFLIVTLQADYINGVIMTTALLFIPEIDDQLPRLLGLDQNAIIENYLLNESKLDYEQYAALSDKDIDTAFRRADDVESQGGTDDPAFGVNFCDYFLTNSVLEGSDAHDFCQPFNVVKANNIYGHELSPSNFITEDCLLKRVEWRYVDSKAMSPTIGYLRLIKLSGEVIEIDCTDYGTDVEKGTLHHLEGLFVITNFIITTSEIESLRLAGTDTAHSFRVGIEHYSLWELTSDAISLLKKKVGI
jgi:hypothetical protein